MHIDPLSVIYMSAKTYVLYRSKRLMWSQKNTKQISVTKYTKRTYETRTHIVIRSRESCQTA